MYPAQNPHTSHFSTHPKYQLLLQRGYTPQQIQMMIQQRHSQTQHHRDHNRSTRHSRTTTTTQQQPLYTHPTADPPLPQPPQPPSIDQSVMFSFQNASNERRMRHSQHTSFPDYVPPRANIQMQFKPDKSSIEGILQDAYELRQSDVFVPQARPSQEPAMHRRQSTIPHHHRQDQQQHSIHPQHKSSRPLPTHQPSSPQQPNRQQHQPIESQHQRRRRFKAELEGLHNDKASAYELLGVGENFTLRELAKKYRKQALKYHPDRLAKHAEYITAAQREECKQMFEKVTKAYLYLMEQHSLRESDKPFYELRDQSRNEVEEQQHTSSGTKVRLMDGDQFDVQLFNKLYDENRLREPTDEGYGDWLKSTPEEDTSELFSSQFNLNVFNTTFDQLKRDNPHSNKQLVKREEMGIVVRGDTTQFTTLGEGVVDDYGGATGDLQYSDLKDAHTTNAMLIDTSRTQKPPQFKSIKEMEAHRSQVSHTLSPAEAELQSYLKEKRERDEYARRERLEQRDHLVAQQHQRIQRQLLQ